MLRVLQGGLEDAGVLTERIFRLQEMDDKGEFIDSHVSFIRRCKILFWKTGDFCFQAG